MGLSQLGKRRRSPTAVPLKPAITTSVTINQAIRLPDPFITTLFMANRPGSIGTQAGRRGRRKSAPDFPIL
jgi:hypothetical protein